MLPNNITDFLAAVSRRKLQREASTAETRRDTNLHRWTLIKNSISHAAARSVTTPTHPDTPNLKADQAVEPESVPIPDDSEDDFYEEDIDLGSVFLFPDASALSNDATTPHPTLTPPISPTDDDVVGFDFEARWLDDVLADLAADDDDDTNPPEPENPLDSLPVQTPPSGSSLSPPAPSAPILGPTVPAPEEDISPLNLSFADILPYGLVHLYPPMSTPALDASSSSDDTCSDDESDGGPATPDNNSQASFDTYLDPSQSPALDLFPSSSSNYFECAPPLFPCHF